MFVRQRNRSRGSGCRFLSRFCFPALPSEDVVDSSDKDNDEDVPLVSVSTIPSAPTLPVDLSSRYFINSANAHFYKLFAFETESRPFMVVRHDINADDVMSVMQTEWKFKGE